MHWADGGATDVDSGALLCGRHHTIVHTHRYYGWLDRSGGHPRVRWDLTRGSYDDFLTGLRPPGPLVHEHSPDPTHVGDEAEPVPELWDPPRRVSGDDTYWHRE